MRSASPITEGPTCATRRDPFTTEVDQSLDRCTVLESDDQRRLTSISSTSVRGPAMMRIAQIAPLYEAVPPSAYGGTERVIAALCDGLVELGHDVTLFAAGESTTRADLVEVVPAPLRLGMTQQELSDVAPHLHLHMLACVYDRAAEFDVIHSH